MCLHRTKPEWLPAALPQSSGWRPFPRSAGLSSLSWYGKKDLHSRGWSKPGANLEWTWSYTGTPCPPHTKGCVSVQGADAVLASSLLKCPLLGHFSAFIASIYDSHAEVSIKWGYMKSFSGFVCNLLSILNVSRDRVCGVCLFTLIAGQWTQDKRGLCGMPRYSCSSEKHGSRVQPTLSACLLHSWETWSTRGVTKRGVFNRSAWIWPGYAQCQSPSLSHPFIPSPFNTHR